MKCLQKSLSCTNGAHVLSDMVGNSTTPTVNCPLLQSTLVYTMEVKPRLR